MPAITSGKVLVSGANGYVASWVIRTLLESGYSVRATVRSESKGVHLRKVFASYNDRLELVVVPDITAVGAFDEAVKGVDAIEHTASPFHLKADEPDEIIVPAVRGTTSMLESALAYGTSVKRVVVTSSCASILSFDPTPRIYTEKNWNEQAIEVVKLNGRNAHPAIKYCASKTLAERAAWEFMEKNQGKVQWDLVVLNPPYVYGPILQEVGSPEALNESMRECNSWLDVRDLGKAHVLAIQTEAAGGERIIVCSGPWKWQDWINAARKAGADIPAGDTSYDAAKATHLTRYDIAKANSILGLTYRTMDETTRDILDDFKEKGWIKV
ncbi:hypothetical protein POSPLADRAFT_1068108 [Postia placenta MAD-698-R-SB12]|uniref:NAD-dependent epimerase/dehydratase domain-containing protein n=1 Tax=Postia placenta MAD-698-R-SB12 TaxID=670580 RepID=A0A1X6MJK2_9APHY|nr:hypothetical protein POSPLADRAFT_1068108 [Postia placenta MAD-698-R-SB12]OSX56416.1 hypothetical protein POSPLADRAFT_1068108 [Postia placenta MAD-698-R-SB12]